MTCGFSVLFFMASRVYLIAGRIKEIREWVKIVEFQTLRIDNRYKRLFKAPNPTPTDDISFLMLANQESLSFTFPFQSLLALNSMEMQAYHT